MSLESKGGLTPASPSHNHHHHYPRTINHVAVSVLELDEAIRWYTGVLGFNLVKGPMEGISDATHIGRLSGCFRTGIQEIEIGASELWKSGRV